MNRAIFNCHGGFTLFLSVTFSLILCSKSAVNNNSKNTVQRHKAKSLPLEVKHNKNAPREIIVLWGMRRRKGKKRMERNVS